MPIPLSQHVLQALLIILLLPTASLEVRAATDDAQAKAISNCFALRRSEPQAAMVVAESILATPGLAVEPEIKALSCLGVAAGMAGDIARAVESAALVESKVACSGSPASRRSSRTL